MIHIVLPKRVKYNAFGGIHPAKYRDPSQRKTKAIRSYEDGSVQRVKKEKMPRVSKEKIMAEFPAWLME